MPSPHKAACQLILDMRADDRVKGCPGCKTQSGRARRREITRPIGDNGGNPGIRFTPMRATTFSPSNRRKAAICSPTVQERPGMERLRRGPVVLARDDNLQAPAAIVERGGSNMPGMMACIVRCMDLTLRSKEKSQAVLSQSSTVP